MGYESKVYIVQEYHPLWQEEVYGDVLAMFDLCNMGYDAINGKTFPDLFNQERTCKFYADDTLVEEDKYGDPIRKADNKEVIKWLRKFCKDDPYWRAGALLSCLNYLEKNGFEYCLYHFGY